MTEIPYAPDGPFAIQLHDLCRKGRPIDAIQLIRETTECDLRTAKTLYEWFSCGVGMQCREQLLELREKKL